MTVSAPMIQLRGVTRDYRLGEHRVHALRGVDLDVAAGDFIAIVGPSGSGKSTLLHILGCLDTPTSGSYRLAGEEVSRLDEDALAEVRSRRIGFVFQSFHLVPRLSARENVELPLVFAGVDPAERRARAEEALRSVGLAPRAEHRPDQLSGGERQRVAIARSIVTRPSILLADEPTGNLDTTSGGEVVDLIRGMNRDGLTCVLVTHNAEVAAQARRRVHVQDGRLSEDGRDVPT